MKNKINWYHLIVIILLTELTGVLSNLLSGNVGRDYTELIKPPLAPPNWIFGIIWPILFLLMGIALYLIYQAPRTPERQKAIILFAAQLAVNFFWPIVFFRFELFWLAVFVIILLDILVILTMVSFFRINRAAGWLLVPYLLWILFATYLNIGIAALN